MKKLNDDYNFHLLDMNPMNVLVFFQDAWRKALILKRVEGQLVIRIIGTNLKFADTEDNLRNGPLQMKDSPDFSAILVEVFPKDGSNDSDFIGYGRAWVGKTPIHGIDIWADGTGQFYPAFQPMFYREAIATLLLTDEQITFLMGRIEEELANSVKEWVAKNYPTAVPT